MNRTSNFLLGSFQNCPIPLPDVIDMEIERFNDHCVRYGFSEEAIARLRDVRRKGKNRQAARKSREKKIKTMDVLRSVMYQLNKVIKVELSLALLIKNSTVFICIIQNKIKTYNFCNRNQERTLRHRVLVAEREVHHIRSEFNRANAQLEEHARAEREAARIRAARREFRAEWKKRRDEDHRRRGPN